MRPDGLCFYQWLTLPSSMHHELFSFLCPGAGKQNQPLLVSINKLNSKPIKAYPGYYYKPNEGSSLKSN